MALIINNPAGQLANNPAPQGGQLVNVPAYQIRPGYRESHSLTSGEARMVVITSWANTTRFASYWLGDAQPGDNGKIKRTPPQRHPLKHLYAVECNLTGALGAPGIDASTGYPVYFDNNPQGRGDGGAEYEIVFRSLPYEIKGDDAVQHEGQRWITFEYNPTVEALSLPGGSFKWKSDNVQIPEGIAVQRPLLEVRFTIHQVPLASAQNNHINTIRDVMGKVNREEYIGYARESALCLTPRLGPFEYLPSGSIVRTVEHTILVRLDSTWLQFFRNNGAGGGAFDTAIPRDENGRPVYETADFNSLTRF